MVIYTLQYDARYTQRQINSILYFVGQDNGVEQCNRE